MEINTNTYGLWAAVAFNVLLFGLFVVGFLKPMRKREWRSMGLMTAFLVALFTEMYGFPLTIYILTSILGRSYPVLNPFSHKNGHLVSVLLGGSVAAWVFVMMVSNGLILVGLTMMGRGWRKIYRARGELVTDGIYGTVRHPQYVGLLVLVVGFLIQWPTIATVLMAPGLFVMYYRLARREEAELEAAFGDEYRRYKKLVPAFLPLGRHPVAAEQRG
ncbi:MAG: isoprenylcysteine carboxylmethyltransferase family protein [Nitrospinae bacterium]|nr:isoprenylcysteine carboxylmethyltransferase family protein [Nitrospinota bacterium]